MRIYDNEISDIVKRNQIMTCICGEEKISEEERYWLDTHSIYNSKIGYPFLQLSVENIEPNIWYILKLSVEKVGNDMAFYPLIGIPGK